MEILLTLWIFRKFYGELGMFKVFFALMIYLFPIQDSISKDNALEEKWKQWFSNELFIPPNEKLEQNNQENIQDENAWPKEVKQIESTLFPKKNHGGSMGKSLFVIEKVRDNAVDLGVQGLLFLNEKDKEFINYLGIKIGKSIFYKRSNDTSFWIIGTGIGAKIYNQLYFNLGVEYHLKNKKNIINEENKSYLGVVLSVNLFFDFFVIGLGKNID